MRSTRDTFLHFLADNLTSLTIHPIRRDPNNQSTASKQMNAVNVSFGRIDMGVLLSRQYVHLDVVADVELDAVDMANDVWLLLSTRFYTPLMDYSTPASPVATGTMLMWKAIQFVPVDSDLYYQYSCTMAVQFHNELPT